jgi:hypothetical protein
MSIKSTDFQRKFFVLQETSLFDFPLIKQIVFINDDVELINEMNNKFGEKIIQINFTGDIKESLKIENKPHQLIKIFPENRREIIRISKPLKDKRFLICPGYSIDRLEDISLVSSMDLIVDLISVIETIDFDLSMEILNYYLHNQNLNVSIEPFHSILVSKLHHKPKTLWNMNYRNPDMFFYSDGQGLAEDSTNVQNQNYQYLIKHRTKTFLKQKYKSGIDSYYRSLPETQPDCLACAHFHICIGWALFQKDTCTKWKNMLSTLQNASREIQALEKFEKDNSIIPPDKKSR